MARRPQVPGRCRQRETEHLLSQVPGIGKELLQFAQRAEESIKGFLTPGTLFEAFGFDYYGPIDGHNLEDLIETLENISPIRDPEYRQRLLDGARKAGVPEH